MTVDSRVFHEAHRAMMRLASAKLIDGLSQLDRTRLELMKGSDQCEAVKDSKDIVNCFALFQLDNASTETAKYMAKQLGCEWTNPDG